MGNGRGRALVLSNSAWMRHAILGQDERAEDDASEALATYKDIRDIRGQAQCLATLGSVAARRGATGRSWPLFEEALALATEAEDLWLSAQILRAYATAEVEAGTIESGMTHAKEAIRICDSAGMQDLRISVLPVLARLLLATGQPQRALELTSEAMRHLRSGIEMSHLIPLVHASALKAVGSRTEADSHFDLAYRGLMRLLAGLEREHRDRALNDVPGHREIVERWLERRPRQIEVRIASAQAPSGRALTDDEYVPVTWTISDPSDGTITDRLVQRRHRMLRLLAEAAEQGGSPTVADLADALQVATATVRRDLAALRDAGRNVATRGTRFGTASPP
jgi:tetratricopeptide (TPR) repeat protein